MRTWRTRFSYYADKRMAEELAILTKVILDAATYILM
jgi:hypothetical protein